MSQFFYTREEITPAEGDNPEIKKEYLDSFNVDLVLRSMSITGGMVVLLDDLHERTEEVPVTNKNGKVVSAKKNLVIYQSEIRLNESDSERFIKLTSI